jgi:hypothetical protein
MSKERFLISVPVKEVPVFENRMLFNLTLEDGNKIIRYTDEMQFRIDWSRHQAIFVYHCKEMLERKKL